ncbi:unnamed protein product [Hydatigera taeniaeformis]|uniref:2OG-FeII_Oxy_2 domain-containing protein n=1 Tax=Hydatigena taeniaeformis TaxID=6205 RepID=A0A0R3WY66_HYDTA|nr:unnamed protein product [Hydatigera taeniaeformis]
MLRIASLHFSSLYRTTFCSLRCQSSRVTVLSGPNNHPVEFQNAFVKKLVSEELITIPDFISEEEEQNLLSEIVPIFSRLCYQTSHWDDVIKDFRETERKNWWALNRPVIDRLRQKTLDTLKAEPRPEGTQKVSSSNDLLPHIHVLDLAPTGWIKPHVDSIRVCANHSKNKTWLLFLENGNP